MAEGLFDRREPDHIHITAVRANWLSVALTKRVLERVENVEGRVSSSFLGTFGKADPSRTDAKVLNQIHGHNA